ncbi:Putative restriction endonuclease [Neomoorella glycerini]|uniref:Restriction endonuclease n=1 Tax=Neomoorella glycerini TaxID=55779 RepID=A0A6I5ZSR4_9FIRM|nr:Putative restriction endonuclease [Moorella glycerini]
MNQFDDDDCELKETASRYIPEGGLPVPPAKMSFTEFLAWCNEDTWAEWVDGEVVLLTPAAVKHQRVSLFLSSFLANYVLLEQQGQVFTAPFLVHLPEPVRRGREPDIIFIKQENLGRLQANYLDGAPDLVVEITSPESLARDRGEKFREYEAAGVPEYWLVDPDRRQAEFYHLEANGRYHLSTAGAAGVYYSRVIPGLGLKIEWLWQDPPLSALEALQQMGYKGRP